MNAKPDKAYKSPYPAVFLAVDFGLATVLLDATTIAPSGPDWIHYGVEPVCAVACLVSAIVAITITVRNRRP